MRTLTSGTVWSPVGMGMGTGMGTGTGMLVLD